MFPKSVPKEEGTPTPQPLVYLFMYVTQRPPEIKPPTKWWRWEHKVTVQGVPRRRKAYIHTMG